MGGERRHAATTKDRIPVSRVKKQSFVALMRRLRMQYVVFDMLMTLLEHKFVDLRSLAEPIDLHSMGPEFFKVRHDRLNSFELGYWPHNCEDCFLHH